MFIPNLFILIMDYINCCNNDKIKQGDICVIYISEQQKLTLKIEPDAQIQTKFGQLKALDLIGHPFGIRFNCKRGWVLPLRLTPELWTQLLPHRTQILYQADISMILLQLDIKPGSIVVESGTGSGSLSHTILRACRPNGHLYTYDICASRVDHARQEFTEHGFGQNVTVKHRNVCELGYDDELRDKVDACILDLPQTWDAVEHAYRILKPSGSRLCTFSPCIEQVKQNVAKMEELKMRDITTIESLLRPYEVREQNLRLWNEDILEGLSEIDKKRFENLKSTSRGDRPMGGDKISDVIVGEKQNAEDSAETVRLSGKEQDSRDLERALKDPKAPFHSRMLPKKSYTHTKHFNVSVSHSGFLTFATKRC